MKKAFDYDDGRVGNARNTDTLDFASELQDELNRQAIARSRRAMAPESRHDFDGLHCVECSGEIPEARLEMKKIRCVACQTEIEKRNLR